MGGRGELDERKCNQSRKKSGEKVWLVTQDFSDLNYNFTFVQ